MGHATPRLSAMAADLDPRDLEEVRRRVVEPVVQTLIPDELGDVWLYLDTDFVSVRVMARGELVIWSTLGRLDEGLWDAVEWADRFYDMLTNDLPTTGFAWGQQREGRYRVPGPLRRGE
jgi:hypothetical protein